MKLLYVVFFASLLLLYFSDDSETNTPSLPVVDISLENSQPVLREAVVTKIPNEFGRADAGKQIRESGVVVRVLSDDNTGSRHQRFILRLASGQTLLVAHNIDLAPRITGIAINDKVEFYGEYEWNSQGGVVHWTHNDPNGRHTNGWLRSKGRSYQ